MELKQARQEINEIDDKILELFIDRMNLSAKVGEYKSKHDIPVIDTAREREVLMHAQEIAGPENEEYAYRLFSKIMNLSKVRQRKLIKGNSKVRETIEHALLPAGELFPKTGLVACQGAEGANSQLAAEKLIPRGNVIYLKSFDAVFSAVESGMCKFGIVPIENNVFGSVRMVYQLMIKNRFSIVRAVSLNIRHELLAKKGAVLSNITEIYSHEQAIGQCSKFVGSLGNNVRVIPCPNTAEAAKMVHESKNPYIAAIANDSCTGLYNLDVLCDNIQDSDNNYTKFIMIEKGAAIYPGSNKLSIVITCPDKSGSLADILTMFSAHGINMSKLESCPVVGKNYKYVFYVELDTSVREPGVIAMLEELEHTCQDFAFLGNYTVIS